MFENKVAKDTYVYYSRFIASFIKAGGKISYRGEFRDWLEHLGLNKEDIDAICNMATNGKLELEHDAKYFLIERRSKIES